MESKLYNMLKRMEGLQTIESIQNMLKVRRSTAIKLVHLLRKEGLVKTKGGGRQPRFYEISLTPKVDVGGRGLYETINKYSKVKIVEPYKHRITDEDMSVEEAIARAIASKEFRTILASLGLFNHVKNWQRLHFYADKYDVKRKAGALYDVARACIKTRKMDGRVIDKLKKGAENRFIIKNMKSKDFKDIEKKWNVFIPFNKADLWRYKE